jgi:hypothetical protein
MKKASKLVVFTLALIIILSLLLRLYRQDLNIPPLYADEVGGHYVMLNSLKNHDVSIVRYLYQLIFYGTNTMTWIFGLTPTGVRMWSLVYMTIFIVVFFKLTRKLSHLINDKNSLQVALISSSLAAVLPWTFILSRIGITDIPILCLLCSTHFYLLLKAINSKKISKYILSLIPLFLGTYIYLSMVVITPIVLFVIFLLALQEIPVQYKKTFVLVSCTAVFLIIAAMSWQYKIFSPDSRGMELAIWRDVNVTADANKYRGLARLSEPTIFSFNKDTEALGNKLVYNYPISVVNVFISNYLSFFTPDFLFLKGDPVLRHSTGMVGEFFPFLLPFMVYGAFIFFQKADKKIKLISLTWILVSPIPAAITKDGAGYLLRVITLMPILTYFCAQGIVSSFILLKSKLLQYLLGVFLLLISLYSAYYFYYGYFHVYPALSADSYESGFKELSDFQKANGNNLLVIWDDKYPVNHFCFWQELPSTICKLNSMSHSESINTTRIDFPIPNLFFSLPETEADLNLILIKYKPAYMAIPSRYLPVCPIFVKKNQPVQVINNPDNSVAFNIYQIK